MVLLKQERARKNIEEKKGEHHPLTSMGLLRPRNIRSHRPNCNILQIPDRRLGEVYEFKGIENLIQ